MVIIGFDPSSVSFGVGILKKENNKIFYIHSEEIKLKAKSFYLKMKDLLKRLEELYLTFPIGEASIEEGFLGKNIKSMNILSKVRGVVLCSLIGANINLKSYSPKEVKLALTGNGNALKSQVNKMIRILLNIKQMELSDDESDALAIAYCHLLNLK